MRPERFWENGTSVMTLKSVMARVAWSIFTARLYTPGFSGAVKLDEISVVSPCESTALVPLGAPFAIDDPGVCVVNRTRPDCPRSGARNASIASLMYAVFGALGAKIAFAT